MAPMMQRRFAADLDDDEDDQRLRMTRVLSRVKAGRTVTTGQAVSRAEIDAHRRHAARLSRRDLPASPLRSMTPAGIIRRALRRPGRQRRCRRAGDAEPRPPMRRATQVRGLQDAWKNPTGQMQQPPDNGDPDGDEDDGKSRCRRAMSTSGGLPTCGGSRLATATAMARLMLMRAVHAQDQPRRATGR